MGRRVVESESKLETQREERESVNVVKRLGWIWYIG